ncbi:MAG: formyltetrahydrofolate deformylase, partial [Candidatus Azotimanducaceae bacterium]
MTDYVLTLHCPDRVGVVSAVASILSQANAFITDISQYSDSESRLFSSRTVFDDREMSGGFNKFSDEMARLAAAMDMDYV